MIPQYKHQKEKMIFERAVRLKILGYFLIE